MDRHAKVFTLPSSSNLQLRGQRSKFETVSNDENNKVNLLIMDRQTKVSTVTLLFDLPLVSKVMSNVIISIIGQMHELTCAIYSGLLLGCACTY